MFTRSIFRMLGAASACAMLLAGPASAQHQSGPGPGMGHGMTGHGMMGPGMMGPGMTEGGNCPCGMMWGERGANVNLSASDVRGNLEQWLQRNGNARLSVGDVVETDSNTITADIVTAAKGDLVERYLIDRHTGYYRAAR